MDPADDLQCLALEERTRVSVRSLVPPPEVEPQGDGAVDCSAETVQRRTPGGPGGGGGQDAGGHHRLGRR